MIAKEIFMTIKSSSWAMAAAIAATVGAASTSQAQNTGAVSSGVRVEKDAGGTGASSETMSSDSATMRTDSAPASEGAATGGATTTAPVDSMSSTPAAGSVSTPALAPTTDSAATMTPAADSTATMTPAADSTMTTTPPMTPPTTDSTAAPGAGTTTTTPPPTTPPTTTGAGTTPPL